MILEGMEGTLAEIGLKCKIFSKYLMTKAPERIHSHPSVFLLNYEQIFCIVAVVLLLI